MEVQEIISMISNLGFPIVVCGYFALRLEKLMSAVEAALDRNTSGFAALCALLQKGGIDID
ncbi:MAG: YvrJ family protein [Peptococcaceae bacterium]|nr:YvrJ family protein [Peptococcaceae bacterium]